MVDPIMLLRSHKPPRICQMLIKQLFLDQQLVLILRIPMIPTNIPFEFKILQFFLKIYFVKTINKS